MLSEGKTRTAKGIRMDKEHTHHASSSERLFRYAELLGYGDIHVKFDRATGLRAIVAIHNLNRGPAIGGCRFVTYPSFDAALEDAVRLGNMMSLKAAISNLPHGGGKAVILKPKVIKDREAFFESFGQFVNELGGRYITAVDSGTSPVEMDIIARRTQFVTCTTASGSTGDPSPETALGVRRGIEAAVKFKLNRDTLDGIHVTIQGAGHVGYYLAKELHQHGARMTMCDINENVLQRCVDEFNVATCAPEEIYDIQADVFAPCALGKVLNLETVRRLKVKIIAGSANNQLAHHHHGVVLHENGILYAPDFVINAGGLIYVAGIYNHANAERALQQVSDIYYIMMEIFERSARENLSTVEISEKMAREKLLQP